MKIDKPVSRLTKKKERTQIKEKNERDDVTTNTTVIQNVRDYYE